MATITKPEIQSAAIFRCTDRQTHEKFYVVASDTQPHVYYQVHFDHNALRWSCDCPARKAGCKHANAVNEVLKLRRQRIAQSMGPEMEVAVARMQAQEDRRQAAAERQAERLTRSQYTEEFGIY